MQHEVAKAVRASRDFKKHCEDRLRLGQTKIVIDASGEVSYKSKPRGDPAKSRPFKPLQQMTMNMLGDAVNHRKLKKRIEEEVKSERESQKGGGRASSSEDLYSDAGGYELPQIDPDQLNIAAQDEERQ